MNFCGAFTWRDHVRAFFLDISPRRGFVAIGLLLIGLLILMLIDEWRDYLIKGRGNPWSDSFVVLGTLVMFFVYYPFTIYRKFFSSRDWSLPITFRLSDTGILISCELWSQEIGWDLIASFRESKHVFLLYSATKPLAAIPKRIVGDEEAQLGLREILLAHATFIQ